MTRKPRSPSAVPAGSTRSKPRAGTGMRSRVPKLPKPKRRVQQNRNLEEALLKIAEIWQDVLQSELGDDIHSKSSSSRERQAVRGDAHSCSDNKPCFNADQGPHSGNGSGNAPDVTFVSL